MATHLFHIWTSTDTKKEYAHKLADYMNKNISIMADRVVVIELTETWMVIAGNERAKKRGDKIIAEITQAKESADAAKAASNGG